MADDDVDPLGGKFFKRSQKKKSKIRGRVHFIDDVEDGDIVRLKNLTPTNVPSETSPPLEAGTIIRIVMVCGDGCAYVRKWKEQERACDHTGGSPWVIKPEVEIEGVELMMAGILVPQTTDAIYEHLRQQKEKKK